MPQSRRPGKAAPLSSSLRHHLDMYALAASAAGVSLLALTPPAEARIVYTPTHKTITKNNGRYYLDVNHDKLTDYAFWVSSLNGPLLQVRGSIYCFHTAPNSVMGTFTQSFHALAFALNKGSMISNQSGLSGYATMVFQQSGQWFGHWVNAKNRYLGLRFLDKHCSLHYGWARLSVKTTTTSVSATLTGYAYETIANKGIIAGKTKGPDVITVEPATLGHLARGASAIPAWRQRESVGVTH